MTTSTGGTRAITCTTTYLLIWLPGHLLIHSGVYPGSWQHGPKMQTPCKRFLKARSADLVLGFSRACAQEKVNDGRCQIWSIPRHTRSGKAVQRIENNHYCSIVISSSQQTTSFTLQKKRLYIKQYFHTLPENNTGRKGFQLKKRFRHQSSLAKVDLKE